MHTNNGGGSIASYTSLTHISGHMRPKRKGRSLNLYVQQNNARREAASWLPKGFVELPRFEIPLDVQKLATLTPLQYLSQYCIISSRVKKLLYHRQYSKYREPKVDGIDSIYKMKKALKDICTFSISTQSLSPSDSALSYYLHTILQLDIHDNIKIKFKTFLGIGALAERIFNPNYMESWWKHEKELESDMKTYKTLREQEIVLKDVTERREIEQQNMREMEQAIRLVKRLSLRNNSDKDVLFLKKESFVELAASSSEQLLSTQVESNRLRLEKKTSITEILDMHKEPKKCPKEVLEQVDFHAVKWKFKDVDLSQSMQRIITIILNL